MPRALRDFITDLRTDLRDTSGSQNIYSDVEITRALQRAQQEAQSGQAFWINAVHESISTGANQNRYTLPDYIDRITMVERDILPYPSSVNSGAAQWQLLRSWQHLPDLHTNQLWFQAPLPANSRLRIHYERPLPVFPMESTLYTSISATGLVIPFSSSPTYRMDTWPLPGYAKIWPGGDIFYYDAVTATSFTNVTRGMFRTGTATMTKGFGTAVASPTVITPVWVDDGHPAENFFYSKTMHNLLMMRLQDADVEGDRSVGVLAAEWARAAMEAKATGRQRHEPRTLTIRRQTR